MEKISVAIVGYGNVGQFAVEAVQAAPDMELAGIVRRVASGADIGVPVVDDLTALGKVDVALLCLPTRSVPDAAKKYLAMGINTVDSYDIHPVIAAAIFHIQFASIHPFADSNGRTTRMLRCLTPHDTAETQTISRY